ncbi:hypothetical protein CLAIMM_01503 [Cladophialophora immunda]|nr:hypothetical protein CLAIMM_01503 [Cladophialophora immunda]
MSGPDVDTILIFPQSRLCVCCSDALWDFHLHLLHAPCSKHASTHGVSPPRMPSSLSYLVSLLLSTSVLPSFISAQSSTQFGQCADNCVSTYPIVNHCNGTETGTALDECKCESYSPSNDPLINCVLGCPSDQQLAFADSLPKLCAQTLFLGLDLSDQPKPSAENSAASATVDAAKATGTTSGNSAASFAAGANMLGYLALTLGIAVLL